MSRVDKRRSSWLNGHVKFYYSHDYSQNFHPCICQKVTLISHNVFNFNIVWIAAQSFCIKDEWTCWLLPFLHSPLDLWSCRQTQHNSWLLWEEGTESRYHDTPPENMSIPWWGAQPSCPLDLLYRGPWAPPETYTIIASDTWLGSNYDCGGTWLLRWRNTDPVVYYNQSFVICALVTLILAHL